MDDRMLSLLMFLQKLKLVQPLRLLR